MNIPQSASLDQILHTPVTHCFAQQGFTQQSAAAVPADINALVNRVLARLPIDVPFVMPKHISQAMGMKPDAFYYHCRNCKTLKLWKGDYRFFMDDPDHVKALKDVIKLALWSGYKLPDDLRLQLSVPRTSSRTRKKEVIH